MILVSEKDLIAHLNLCLSKVEIKTLHLRELFEVRSAIESEPRLFTPSPKTFPRLYLMTWDSQAPLEGTWY